MANDKTTANGNSTTTTASTGCGGGTTSCGTDVMSEWFKAARTMNQRMLEAWGKGVPTFGMPMDEMARKWFGFVNTAAEMNTRFVTEAAKVGFEQVKATTENAQRMTEVMLKGFEGKSVEQVPATTRTIVEDVMEVTSRNTERMVRMGLTQAEEFRGLVAQTMKTGIKN